MQRDQFLCACLLYTSQHGVDDAERIAARRRLRPRLWIDKQASLAKAGLGDGVAFGGGRLKGADDGGSDR